MRERLRYSQLTPQPQQHYVEQPRQYLAQPTTTPSHLSSSSHDGQVPPAHMVGQPPYTSVDTAMGRAAHSNICYSSAQQLQQQQHPLERIGSKSGTVPESSLGLVVDDADVAAGQTTTATKSVSVHGNIQSQLKEKLGQPQQQQKQPGTYGAGISDKNGSTTTMNFKKAPSSGNMILEEPALSNLNHFYMGGPASRYSNASLAPRSAATSRESLASESLYRSDLEIFDEPVSDPVLVLGVDITHLDRNSQFFVCASGVFGFSLLYGYLQELISVRICGRQLGLFLAMVQFFGYTVLAFFLRNFVYAKEQRRLKTNQRRYETQNQSKKDDDEENGTMEKRKDFNINNPSSALAVPLVLYLGLSILRAIDLGMTNMAMQYINYPAKTLMKSSRVVFTMMFGVVISRKKYKLVDYTIVLAMVAGLALFMHADANSSAVFDLSGVLMLTISLLCDGAISNVSESIMSKFGVGQDEVSLHKNEMRDRDDASGADIGIQSLLFKTHLLYLLCALLLLATWQFIFRVYSIALVAITGAAVAKGDFVKGFIWLFQPGTYDELQKPVEERTWTVMGKITVIVLFSSMGFFGSSCSAAITKNFGALTMSITSTARKAATLFLSFFLFNNVCTIEHILGVVVFIMALTAKSLRRSKSDSKSSRKIKASKRRHSRQLKRHNSTNSSSSSLLSLISDISDVEMIPAIDGVCDTSIPAVVHTDNLRSRPVLPPAKGHVIVTTI